ncbi:VirB8/TrbF family protein [Sphingomonas sp. PB2P12]|uniref:virB8 family protein n=1 Tax=Sphingomonas sandaracina TaxID=3096157 RepID=UPI002FC60312
MKKDKAALEAYFAEGDSWARDRNDTLRRSRTGAWIVAGTASAVAIFEAIALVALVPLKTVEPYTLLVDRQTGYVQALKPVDGQLVTSDSALTQSFLVQYVIAREGYDYTALQSDYRKVALWSGGQARADYLTTMQASNPASPLARLPRSTTIDVEVKSVSPLGRNAALVRFDTRRKDAGGQARILGSWVAIVRYSYSGAPMSVADRMINPLGFRVTSYRRNPEVLPSVEPASVDSSARQGIGPASPRTFAPTVMPERVQAQ